MKIFLSVISLSLICSMAVAYYDIQYFFENNSLFTLKFLSQQGYFQYSNIPQVIAPFTTQIFKSGFSFRDGGFFVDLKLEYGLYLGETNLKSQGSFSFQMECGIGFSPYPSMTIKWIQQPNKVGNLSVIEKNTFYDVSGVCGQNWTEFTDYVLGPISSTYMQMCGKIALNPTAGLSMLLTDESGTTASQKYILGLMMNCFFRNYEPQVYSGFDDDFNSIAWSVGDSLTWHEEPLEDKESVLKFYSQYNYIEDFSCSEKTEIVLFCLMDVDGCKPYFPQQGGMMTYTHSARKIGSQWSSKLGIGPLVTYNDIQLLVTDDLCYGLPGYGGAGTCLRKK